MLTPFFSYLIGGLQPMVGRLLWDGATILGLAYALRNQSLGLLILLWSISLHRWTLTVPMVPLILIQFWLLLCNNRPRHYFLSILGYLCLSTSVVLCLLFPAVVLPPLTGPYRVGVVDVFLTPNSIGATRILYPTLDTTGTPVPYIPPAIAHEYCAQFMAIGAPPAFRKFGWILHTWRLTYLEAWHNASVVDKAFPIVVFSHGLVGTAALYSFQTMALVARGYIVVSMTHTDGSAPIVALANGTNLYYDHDIVQLWRNQEYVEYARQRRKRTEHRTMEVIAATEAVYRLNQEDYLDVGPSFRGKLLTNATTFMGHSFGASTALTAAARRPDLVQQVVAHEPALDWTPDDVRASLFAPERLEGLNQSFSGGSGGLDDVAPTVWIHDKELLFLFSEEWRSSGRAWNHLLHEMYRNKRLGKSDHSALHYIDGAHHAEFSDTSMLMPLWLSRLIKLTGAQSDPIASSWRIHDYTRDFLEGIHGS